MNPFTVTGHNLDVHRGIRLYQSSKSRAFGPDFYINILQSVSISAEISKRLFKTNERVRTRKYLRNTCRPQHGKNIKSTSLNWDLSYVTKIEWICYFVPEIWPIQAWCCWKPPFFATFLLNPEESTKKHIWTLGPFTCHLNEVNMPPKWDMALLNLL